MVIVYSGSGLLNSLINKSPFELHAPGYNFLGPGTKLEERLAKGIEPRNKLDALAREHDIFYSKHSSLADRHTADKVLQLGATERIRARSASPGERFWATVTAASMKGKRIIGAGTNLSVTNMGSKRKHRRSRPRTSRRRKRNTSNSTTGASIQFTNAVKHVANNNDFSEDKSLKTNVKNALMAFRKLKKQKRIKYPIRRTIALPKTGGVLPLIPIISGISALGGLAGGVSSIIKAIRDINEARKNVFNKNSTVTTGNGFKIGRGSLYLPKRGRGSLYLPKRSR
jgi:hypothetical protein